MHLWTIDPDMNMANLVLMSRVTFEELTWNLTTFKESPEKFCVNWFETLSHQAEN